MELFPFQPVVSLLPVKSEWLASKCQFARLNHTSSCARSVLPRAVQAASRHAAPCMTSPLALYICGALPGQLGAHQQKRSVEHIIERFELEWFMADSYTLFAVPMRFHVCCVCIMALCSVLVKAVWNSAAIVLQLCCKVMQSISDSKKAELSWKSLPCPGSVVSVQSIF